MAQINENRWAIHPIRSRPHNAYNLNHMVWPHITYRIWHVWYDINTLGLYNLSYISFRNRRISNLLISAKSISNNVRGKNSLSSLGHAWISHQKMVVPVLWPKLNSWLAGTVYKDLGVICSTNDQNRWYWNIQWCYFKSTVKNTNCPIRIRAIWSHFENESIFESVFRFIIWTF